VKGLAGIGGLDSVEDLLRSSQSIGDSISLQMPDSQAIEHFPTKNVKAIFLVKTFEGNRLRNPVHFHNHRPISKGLWVRIGFEDGENMEGILENCAKYVLQPGFTFIPTDPTSNNRLVYVPKDRLTSFAVLGLRNPPIHPQGRDTF
jgi:hypothetical protein